MMIMKKILLLFSYCFLFSYAIPIYAQIAIVSEQQAVDILPDMAGYNSNTANMWNPWDKSTRRSSWKQSGAPLIRYPGGTVSTYWDHRKDRLFGIHPDNVININDDENRYFIQRQHTIGWVTTFHRGHNPLYDLKKLYTEMEGGMNVMFVLNMVTPGPDYYSKLWNRELDQTPLSDDWWAMMDARYENALVMLKNAENQGIPVKYIEFGNEYFFGFNTSGNGKNGGSIVEPYSAGSTSHPEIVGAFPQNGEHYADAVNDWAGKLKELYPQAKLCAIGADANSNLPTRRNNWNENVIANVDNQLVEAVSFHIYGGISEGSVKGDELSLGRALNILKHNWEEDSLKSKMPDGFEYWFTEYDASSNNAGKGEKSWGLGLATIYQACNWMKNGNLGLLAFHHFPDAGDTGTLTGFGRAYSYFSKASRFCHKASRLNLSNTTDIVNGVEDVQGWKFFDNEKGTNKFLIVNYSGTSKQMSFSEDYNVVGQTYEMSSHALSSLNDTNVQTGTLAQNITLPPFSVFMVESAPAQDTPYLTLKYEASLVLNNTAINLGSFSTDDERFSTKILLKNTGNQPLVIDKQTSDLTGDEEFSIGELPAEIEAGANVEISLEFLAGSILGHRSATLTIHSNSGNNATYTVNIKSFVYENIPQLELTLNNEVITNQQEIDFGIYEGGEPLTKTFKIENTGYADLLINDIVIEGGADNFVLVGVQKSQTIEPENAIEFSIKYLPVSESMSTATITIDSNLDDYTFDVKGENTTVLSLFTLKEMFKVYPTSWGSDKDIKLNLNGDNITLIVTTLLGEKILALTDSEQGLEKALNQLNPKIAKGVYLLRFQYNGLNHTQKIIKH